MESFPIVKPKLIDDGYMLWGEQNHKYTFMTQTDTNFRYGSFSEGRWGLRNSETPGLLDDGSTYCAEHFEFFP